MAAALLHYGAHTNALTAQGVAALHLAAQEGHADVAALLLEHGARVNLQTKVGVRSRGTLAPLACSHQRLL